MIYESYSTTTITPILSFGVPPLFAIILLCNLDTDPRMGAVQPPGLSLLCICKNGVVNVN